MDSIKPPEPLQTQGGNLAERWERFREQFNWYLYAINAHADAGQRKVGILLTVAGPEAQKVFKTFTFAPARAAVVGPPAIPAVPAESPDDYDCVMEKFTQYCVPRKNLIYERYAFNTRNQQEGESVDTYVTDLKWKAQSCEYGELSDSLIRDRLVVGIRDARLKEKMLIKEDLTLDAAITMCKAAETTQQQMKLINPLETEQVNAVRTRGRRHDTGENVTRDGKEAAARSDHVEEDANREYQCKRCGTRHGPRKCPAYKAKCNNCGKRGHYAKLCFKKVNVINDSDESSSEDHEQKFVGTINVKAPRSGQNTKPINRVKVGADSKWTHLLRVENQIVPVKLDTGAGADLLSYRDYRKMRTKAALKPTNVRLTDYNDREIQVKGACILYATVKGVRYPVRFIVVNNGPSLLGHESSERLGLVKRVNHVDAGELKEGTREVPGGGHVSKRQKEDDKLLTVEEGACTLPEVNSKDKLSCLPFEYDIKLTLSSLSSQNLDIMQFPIGNLF